MSLHTTTQHRISLVKPLVEKKITLLDLERSNYKKTLVSEKNMAVKYNLENKIEKLDASLKHLHAFLWQLNNASFQDHVQLTTDMVVFLGVYTPLDAGEMENKP